MSESQEAKKAVPMKVRLAVYQRDDFTCQHCGNKGGDLVIDHVIPRERGGTNDPENLVTSCATCNLQKGSRTTEEWRKSREALGVDLPEYLTIKQVAVYFGCSESTVRYALKDGRLHAADLGNGNARGTTLVARSEVERIGKRSS